MSLARLRGTHCLISGSFVTTPPRRRLSDADRAGAGMAEWWEVARRLVVMTQVASVTKRLRHRFANTGSVAERGHAGWPGPPPGSKTDLLS